METNNDSFVYSDEFYWEKRWKVNSIEFHKTDNNPMLVKHIDKLTQNRSEMKFLFPLCGKAVDMAWLSSQGHTVVGIEFVQEAVEQFFYENIIKYSVKDIPDFRLYTSEDASIKIYCGDFFKFSIDDEALFDCVWDRGGLVALPADLREKFAGHIQKLLQPNFRYLLDVFEYDASLYPGPPHLVTLEEIKKLYGSKCKIELIDTQSYRVFSEDLKEVPPKEMVYLLSNL